MLVSCAKCGSKYQLSDEKIKASGTKVRCPRCQNTFKVFPTPIEEDESDERTELFARKDVPVSPKKEMEPTVSRRQEPVPTPSHAASRAMTEIQPQSKRSPAVEKVPDDEFPLPSFPERVEPTVARHPVSDPATSNKKSKAVEEHFVEESVEQNEESASQEDEGPRPFGDATFLAIQKMGSGKQSKRKALIAASLALIVVAAFFLISRGPIQPDSEYSELETKSVEPVKLSRPSNWYDDDPEVLQRFLTQMASLPAEEQTQPKNRSQIAEALILNGLLSGNFDQVAQGMGFSSSLLASDPDRTYGFYGLATYALYKDDLASLTDLVNKWPSGNQGDPEFKWSTIYVKGKGTNRTSALEMARDLLAKKENGGFRMTLAVLSVGAETWNEASQIIGEDQMASLLRAFNRRKDSLERSQVQLPALMRNLDRKLQRRAKDLEQSPKSTAVAEGQRVSRGAKKPEAPIVQQAPAPEAPRQVDVPVAKASPSPAVPAPEEPSPLQKKVEDSATASLNQRVAERMKAAQTSKPSAKPAPAPAAKPTKLPKPSAELVAANKQEVKEESEAAKLFREGERFLGEKKEEEAILAFQKSLRFDPDFAESYRKLGEIYMQKADKERALRSLKIYLQLKPDSSDKQLVEGWISSLQ